MIEVDVNGTIVEFPDGTPPDVMKAALRRRFPAEQPPAQDTAEFLAAQPAAPVMPPNAPQSVEEPQQAGGWASILRGIVNPSAAVAGRMTSDPMGQLKALGQGLSFNTADELSARLSQALGGDYQSSLESYRRDLGQMPASTRLPAEIAGGLVTGVATAPVAAAGLATKAGQALPKIVQAMGVGGAYGGLYGAGGAEEGDRLASAGAGAGLGALTAGGIYGAGQLARGIAGGTKELGGNIRDRLTAHTRPQEAALRTLERAIADEGITPARMQRRLDALGERATIADAGGERVKNTLAAVAAEPGPAKQAVATKLESRLQGAQRRLSNTIAKTVAQGDLDFDSAVLKLHENMRNIAKTHGYDDVLNSGAVNMDDELRKLMNGTTMKSALGKAYSILDDDIALGRADAKLREFFTFKNPRTGATEEVPKLVAQFSEDTLRPAGARFDPSNFSRKTAPTLRVWDYVKRGLDDIIGEGTDPITGKLTSQAERALDFKRRILERMDAENPAYAAVRKLYADEKAAESSIKLGAKFLSDKSEVTARRIAGMTESEQQYFRMGAGRALRDKIMQGVNSGSSFRSVYKSPAIREKVRAIFPDAEARREFERAMVREIRFANTRNAAMTGSRTAVLENEMEGLKKTLGSMAAVSASGVDTGGHALVKASAANRLARGLVDKLQGGDPSEFNRLLGQMLVNFDPAQNAALLQSLASMPKPIVPPPRPTTIDPLTQVLMQQVGQRAGSMQ